MEPGDGISPEARALIDVQLALSHLAEQCGAAAARIDQVAVDDRPDVLSLYRRRVGEVRDELGQLFDGLGPAA